ncbi:MAG: phytanoyl-CoA dioxygenase family protein [Burkholderiaceae bacterium]
MIELKTPGGFAVEVPELIEEDRTPRFSIDDLAAARKHYDEEGYVLLSGLLSGADCDLIRGVWDREVKPFKGFIYRQTTGKAERHQKNAQNWIMNPVINLQSLDSRVFPEIKEAVISRFLTADGVSKAFGALFDQPYKIIQSMYFEGHNGSPEHQDTYYSDSINQGAICAAWAALEDIAADAGRLFLCPRSHRVFIPNEIPDADSIGDHSKYIELVRSILRERGFEFRAPALQKGDTLFWNARTIHGAFKGTSTSRSRSSLTCHAIPAADPLQQLQRKVILPKTRNIRGVEIFSPKDQELRVNRVILNVEARFPVAFHFAKRKMASAMVRRRLRKSRTS